MRYRCIIVDDDPISASILAKYIEAIPVLELIDTCTNSLQAFDLILRKKIEVIFLDVEIPGLNGTGLVKALQKPPAIIFTTAHERFAVEAFDLDAVDYLLKPITFERFLKAVNKLSRFSTNGHFAGEIQTGFIYFRTSRKMVKVILENILFIECLKDHVIIHGLNEAEIKLKQPFNTLEAILPAQTFLRVHRSYIISKPKVTAFSKDFVEIGKHEIPIGRKYKDISAALAAE